MKYRMLTLVFFCTISSSLLSADSSKPMMMDRTSSNGMMSMMKMDEVVSFVKSMNRRDAGMLLCGGICAYLISKADLMKRMMMGEEKPMEMMF